VQFRLSPFFLVWCELTVCWLAWCAIPIFRAPHNQKRPSITARGPTLAGLLLEMAAYFVAVWWREPVAVAWPRLLVTAVSAPFGVAVMWTAVAHLGRQFRINAGLYFDHQLVRTGPYARVRHPIYASMLAMLLATAMLWTRWPWILLSFALFIAGTEIRVRAEDRLLASRFGAEFTAYRRQVSAYVPFVR
jgi:protein-S-isoprenylcysteine O-methyltransferase Ste14